MESHVNTLDEITREVSVSVPAEEVLQALDEAYHRLNKRVKLQGFRKGKAPRQMLEAHYKHQVEHEVAEEIVGSSLQQAAVSHRLEAVGRPKIEGLNFQPGQPLEFTATVQIIPQFELKSLEGERFVKKVVRVTDDEVHEQLVRLAERFANFEASEEEPLAEGDYAIIDFSRIQEGREVEESKVQAHPIILGDGALHPVLEQQLLGARMGDVREVSIAPDEEVAQESTFRVAVVEVKKRRVPPIDENLARTVGEESLEDMRATLRREMERLEEARASERLRAELSRRLVALHNIPLPDALIEHAVNRLMGDLQRSMAARGHQMDASQLQAENISERLRKPAEELATSDLILDKASADRGIEPAEGEVHQEVARLARQLDKEPDSLRQEMEAEGTLEGLRTEMRRKLVLDTLLSELSVEEKVVDRKEVEEISSE